MSDLCQLLELEVPLATVGGYDHSLSTGQIQKIKIIRALLDERTIPIFDEIFSNLSKKIQAKMYAYLKNLSGKTIIIIDHNAPKVTGATYWEL